MTNYTLHSITVAEPGDEYYQAGQWVPIDQAIVFGSAMDLVKVFFTGGGTHSMPVHVAGQVRRVTA